MFDWILNSLCIVYILQYVHVVSNILVSVCLYRCTNMCCRPSFECHRIRRMDDGRLRRRQSPRMFLFGPALNNGRHSSMNIIMCRMCLSPCDFIRTHCYLLSKQLLHSPVAVCGHVESSFDNSHTEMIDYCQQSWLMLWHGEHNIRCKKNDYTAQTSDDISCCVFLECCRRDILWRSLISQFETQVGRMEWENMTSEHSTKNITEFNRKLFI